MSIINIISFTLVIFLSTSYIHIGNSLNIESIINGEPAPENKLRFIASLNVKSEDDSPSTPICGATIVKQNFLLSISNCVVDENGVFIKQWYEAVLGSRNITKRDGLIVQITKLYLSGKFDPVTNEYNILVIELQYKVDLSPRSSLRKLDIPSIDLIYEYEGQEATFSGYGYQWLEQSKSQNGTWIYNGNTEGNLSYIKVRTISSFICKIIDNRVRESHMCGQSKTSRRGLQCGPCYGDRGGPLAMGNEIIGVLSLFQSDCNDSIRPSIYSKVAPAYTFIKSVFEGKQPADTRTFENPTNPNIATTYN